MVGYTYGVPAIPTQVYCAFALFPKNVPMIVTLESILTVDEVNRMVKRLESAQFSDGRATAGATAARAKKNLELSGQDELQELSDLGCQ